MPSEKIASATIQCGYITDSPIQAIAMPSMINAQAGKIPVTDIKIQLYRDGQPIAHSAIQGLFGQGSSQGYGPAGTEYESVRWTFNPSAGGYTIRGNITKDIVIDCSVWYDNVQYHAPVTVAFTTAPSEPKEPAYCPPPMRWADYATGYQFQDADTYTDVQGTDHPCSRLDIVLHGSAANGLPLPWRCIKSHIKGSAGINVSTGKPNDEPKLGSQYWVAADGGPYNLLATMVLLAQNAFIDILTSNAIRVMKADGTTPSVKLSGGEWPIICGSESPDNAPTKIAADGTFYSRKAVIEGDVVFGGRVKPMLTTITSANYTNYLISDRELFNDSSLSATDYSLDFRKLTGSVVIDSTMDSVAAASFGPGFVIASQYSGHTANLTEIDISEYIGHRLRIVNLSKHPLGITGLCTETRQLDGGVSTTISKNEEIDLECFTMKSNGKRAVGWLIHYKGPKG